MIFSLASFLMKFDPKDNKNRHSRSSSALQGIVLSLELMIVILALLTQLCRLSIALVFGLLVIASLLLISQFSVRYKSITYYPICAAKYIQLL